MLNFTRTNILFAILAILMVMATVRIHLTLYWFLILVLAYSGLLFYGSYYVGSNFFIKVLCSASTKEKQIAISFDDGPAASYTPEILAILKKEQVEGSFFCIGKNIPGNEMLLRQIHENGHLIGNHSFSHDYWFDLFPEKKMTADVQLMTETVRENIGVVPRLFRPPYGVTTPNMKRLVRKEGYTAIGWNVRSLDTVIKNEEKLLKRIEAGIRPGAVILLHDTSAATVAMLPKLISNARSKGYAFVRLDKLLNVQPYA